MCPELKKGEIAMDRTTQTTSQFLGTSIFIGSSYVPEQHSDETQRFLHRPEKHSFAVDFDQMLKTLRTVLSLR
jgi:hypothetical protein